MKTILLRNLAAAACLLFCLSLASCKKDNAGSGSDSTTDLTTAGDDQQQVSNESDKINDDANTVLTGQADFSGDGSSTTAIAVVAVNSRPDVKQMNGLIHAHDYICDATVTYDTANGQRTVSIVYDGTNCWGNRTRTGTVTIAMPIGQHWKDAGATATITVSNLSITRIRDGKTIVLNGTKTITNVSGGLLNDLSSLQQITHRIAGTLKIEFTSGKQATWNVSKQRVFTYDNGIVITTTGTHSDGTNNNIAEWGTNRFDESFTSLISLPKVIRQDCDLRLVSGQNTVITNKGTSVITYGLDASGNPTGCPGTGNYYFKLVYTASNGKTYTIIWPY